MKNISLFTKGFLATLLVVGSALPVFAEPFPQPSRSYEQAIIDWEDEFVSETDSTVMTKEFYSAGDLKVAPAKPSSNVPVIDWEDEFTYEVPTGESSNNKEAMSNNGNAASWDFEAWQSI